MKVILKFTLIIVCNNLKRIILMPSIIAKYLGTINENIEENKTVVQKYIAKITIDELSQWFQYTREKKGGRHPFKVSDTSIIQIHERVQRGKNDYGFVLQDKAKIDDISKSLLKINTEAKKVYLGSLVWNIRKSDKNTIKKIKISEDDNLPPEYELRINVDKIYLTDSAHRHFGIVEAYKEYRKEPKKYPEFDENFEFSVEIYNLSQDDEQNLFNELNSKQKKITAAKQKELDNSTPLGKIKDSIIDYDLENKKIFYNNIELNSNKNTRHTLMTMSVFVASIKEMFKNDIIEVDKNNNDELKEEIVKYYCDFFTVLKENIQIKYTDFGEEKDIYPFDNLYLKYIYPVENSDYEDEILDNKLDEAREKAKRINAEIRKQDLIIDNVSIKALSRLGKLIRKMSNWKTVIEQLQQSLILGHNGKFLQKTNKEILEKYRSNKEALATLNEDGSLNMQVVSWKVNDLYNFYVDKLLLKKDTELHYSQNGFSEKLVDGDTILVSLNEPTTIQFKYTFYIADNLFDEILLEDLLMSIVIQDNWSKIKFTGKKSFNAIKKDYDEGYMDNVYDTGIKRATANFEVTLPKFENSEHLSSGLKVKIKAPNLSIDNEEEFIFKTEEA
ncbi:MAG: hypothetical protein ACWA5P_03255 [bacterium]